MSAIYECFMSDRIGIVYLFSNKLYAKEGIHKFGYTQNPFQRKLIQSNSTPPGYPFENEIVVFTKKYKEFEKALKVQFKESEMLLSAEKNETAGTEWIQCDNFKKILDIFKSVLLDTSIDDAGAILCCKNYIYQKDKGERQNRPKCTLSLLGLHDGDKIVYRETGKDFVIRNNNILVNDVEVSLSTYVKDNPPAHEKAKLFNGYRYFYYKGQCLHSLWMELTSASPINFTADERYF